MKTKIVSVLAMLAFANVAAAEQDGFKISGDFATSYFMEDGKDRNDAYPVGGAIGNGSNDGAFSVDMVEMNVEKAVGNSSFVLGLGFGRIFDSINYVVDSNIAIPTTPEVGVPRSGLNLTNAYFAHKVGDTGLSFKLGKFESFMGHETYNYMDNLNYTRGYAFYYTMPFYFTGVNVNYAINDMIDVTAVVANSVAGTDIDDNRNKVYAAGINVKPMEGLGIKLNYLTGNEGTGTEEVSNQVMNAVVSYNMNNMDFAVQWTDRAVEGTGANTAAEVKTQVIGLYAGYKADVWGAGLRYEMVDYDAGAAVDAVNPLTSTSNLADLSAADNTINAITLSAWYDIDQNARLKLDVAQHSSDEDIFADDSGAAEDSVMVYGLGFAYRF